MQHFFRRTAVFFFLALSLHSADFTVGAPVEVLWSGTWFKGKVVAVEQGKWKISYDGYGSSWNESVGPDRIRGPGSAPPAPAPGSTAAGAPLETPLNFPNRPAGKHAGLEGAYLRVQTSSFGGRLSLTNEGWFFTKEGRVSLLPSGGFNLAEFNSAKKATSADGVYWVDGATLTILWAKGGEPQNFKVEVKRNEISLDGLAATRAEGFKRGWRANVLYEGGASAGGGGTYVAASNSLQLRRDGTFGGDAVSTMSSASPTSLVSGGGTSSTAGTYEFDGYTLTLKHADGRVEKSSVFAYSDRDAQGAPEYIWREGTMMHRIDAKK